MDFITGKQAVAREMKASLLLALERIGRHSRACFLSNDGLAVLKGSTINGFVIQMPGMARPSLLIYCKEACKKSPSALIFHSESEELLPIEWKVMGAMNQEDIRALHATLLGAFFVSPDFSAAHMEKNGYIAGFPGRVAKQFAIETCVLLIRNDFSSESIKCVPVTACIVVH